MKFFGKLYTKKRGKQSECNSDNLSMEEIEKDKKTKEMLTFVEVIVTKGARKDLGRPKSTPTENKTALMSFLK